MPAISCTIATLAVASIYYTWRTYQEWLARRQDTLRERVTYMLWVIANRTE
jgi:hypothetical protein